MLASGRLPTSEMSREYATLAIGESVRLGHLIDNLLAYARITDAAQVYIYEDVPVKAVVDECLQHFRPQLMARGFATEVEVPEELRLVHVDRTAIDLMLSNIIDNAIRYSGDVRHLAVRASNGRGAVTIEVTDKGLGIPERDLPVLTQRFTRGTHQDQQGAGLGLAIVNRVVSDHRGTLSIRSVLGVGTTVTVIFPEAAA
jgi:signal transduction histidine kinase